MQAGTGIDITEVPRIRESIQRFGERFLNRVYTPREQAYCLRKKKTAAESFAARFAAKEAAAKALGTGISHGIGWLEIEVTRDPNGRPGLLFHGRAAERARSLGVFQASLSLTHTRELAMASVSLESADK